MKQIKTVHHHTALKTSTVPLTKSVFNLKKCVELSFLCED